MWEVGEWMKNNKNFRQEVKKVLDWFSKNKYGYMRKIEKIIDRLEWHTLTLEEFEKEIRELYKLIGEELWAKKY